MPIANNLLTSALIAPLVTILSAVSLATVQRGIEWISSVAKNPRSVTGVWKQVKPVAKYADEIIERLLSGTKFTISTTNILLMSISILLICLMLENSEKGVTKRVVVVDPKKKKEPVKEQ